MKGVEEHLEPAADDSDSEYDSEEDKDNMDRDSDNASTDYELDPEVRAATQDNDNTVTDDESGEVAEGGDDDMGVEIEIWETVTKGAEEDPNTKTWTRIEALPIDPRTEERQDTSFKNLRNDCTLV